MVALHGHGGDADWPFDGVHIARHLAATGLAVATVDGGDFYWHAWRSGIDTGAPTEQYWTAHAGAQLSRLQKQFR